MLRFFVATLIAVLFAISSLPVDAQYYRVEHSWKPQPTTFPGMMTEMLKEKYRMESAERIAKHQKPINTQTIHVHVPSAPTSARQGPTWTEYREMAKALQETQLALVALQKELASLRTPRTHTASKKKVTPKRKQPRETPAYEPTSLYGRLRVLDFPLGISLDICKAVRKAPDEKETWVVYKTLFGTTEITYDKRFELWTRYSASSRK